MVESKESRSPWTIVGMLVIIVGSLYAANASLSHKENDRRASTEFVCDQLYKQRAQSRTDSLVIDGIRLVFDGHEMPPCIQRTYYRDR